jgi:WD40 repeat protein
VKLIKRGWRKTVPWKCHGPKLWVHRFTDIDMNETLVWWLNVLFYVSGVYSEPNGTLLCLLLGHSGGITHLQFSPDGTKILSGGRKDSEVICWDIRNPGSVLFSVRRNVATNQRMYFDITPDSRYVVSGEWYQPLTSWQNYMWCSWYCTPRIKWSQLRKKFINVIYNIEAKVAFRIV